MTAILGWLLAVLFGAGGGWALWKRSLDRGQARKDVETELTQKGKEAKAREAEIYSRPRGTDHDVIDRL